MAFAGRVAGISDGYEFTKKWVYACVTVRLVHQRARSAVAYLAAGPRSFLLPKFEKSAPLFLLLRPSTCLSVQLTARAACCMHTSTICCRSPRETSDERRCGTETRAQTLRCQISRWLRAHLLLSSLLSARTLHVALLIFVADGAYIPPARRRLRQVS